MMTPVVFSRGSFLFSAGIILVLQLCGCATVAGSLNPQAASDSLANDSHMVKERIQAGIFTLTAYANLNEPGKPLTIYIEGDGRAWLSKHKLADDPTPFHPMMLKLASIDPSPNVAYLGRPCQYDNSASQKPCGPEYWSDKRFSEEVIASMDEAISILSEKARSGEVYLAGYSGGAAVAVLVAARRNDIKSLRTIAGNLDTEAVNTYHKASAMPGSLNPVDEAPRLTQLPQRHFLGTRDEVVPPSIAEGFIKKLGNSSCAQITEVSGATHHEGWVQKWAELLKLPAACS